MLTCSDIKDGTPRLDTSDFIQYSKLYTVTTQAQILIMQFTTLLTTLTLLGSLALAAPIDPPTYSNTASVPAQKRDPNPAPAARHRKHPEDIDLGSGNAVASAGKRDLDTRHRKHPKGTEGGDSGNAVASAGKRDVDA
ncbi:uncharacterized protein KY384_000338 [Bacidia gigantensis]|uniref:uncharacterized protein n=1 Tax=Bacidia gigantensis TaxID=2732470 RepID=UPI001D0385B7|nr:uncharacterized protein KY384_000338 [Bacidia gigantensis]KAG8526345.1 hypothetical protein KY384_000338 [Bacidia gigantensis]